MWGINFPFKTIPNIIGETTYKAINELRETLYENAGAIPTMPGGGWGGGAELTTSAY